MSIALFPIGNPAPDLFPVLCDAISRELHIPCATAHSGINPAFALHPERSQYHSTMLLEPLLQLTGEGIVIGVTEVDLYIPILTFVFGEAQLGGRAAVVSYHRLRDEFYGLETNPPLMTERLIKETLHEIGHVFELPHCDDYECVMAASHSVEWVDIKTARFCHECRLRIGFHEPAAMNSSTSR